MASAHMWEDPSAQKLLNSSCTQTILTHKEPHGTPNGRNRQTTHRVSECAADVNQRSNMNIHLMVWASRTDVTHKRPHTHSATSTSRKPLKKQEIPSQFDWWKNYDQMRHLHTSSSADGHRQRRSIPDGCVSSSPTGQIAVQRETALKISCKLCNRNAH